MEAEIWMSNDVCIGRAGAIPFLNAATDALFAYLWLQTKKILNS